MTNKFTFIDLFAGIGGFKLALSANGGICIGFSEVNSDAINVYCKNHNIKLEFNFGDITKIKELPYHDILTGGVPCQSWSVAGKNLGFDDDRGQLWNDIIFLLNQSKPKAFIFENVKGLADPRNNEAMTYILKKIKAAGYYANYYVINSHDYGVAQNRIRVYIIGFRNKMFFDKFQISKYSKNRITLADICRIKTSDNTNESQIYSNIFQFNDLRNGRSTIHSWDICNTTERQKEICLLLLRNRRKRYFGPLDGNPLSLKQFQFLDSSITKKELVDLVDLEILKIVNYRFEILDFQESDLTEREFEVLNHSKDNYLVISDIKKIRSLKIKRISIIETINSLLEKNYIKCIEERFDFKNTKISLGLNGVYRVIMPTSDIFPTLVASDTNDYISLKNIEFVNFDNYKQQFIEEIYWSNNYRKITKKEACMIQGFPKDFKLPESRARWMKLIGNSVSVPVIDMLIKSIISTGVIDA